MVGLINVSTLHKHSLWWWQFEENCARFFISRFYKFFTTKKSKTEHFILKFTQNDTNNDHIFDV